jgi:CBS domain-containing protein
VFQSQEGDMSVKRICNPEVDVITAEETAQTAAGRMHARKVGTLVVVNQRQEPIGIVTDRDLAVRIVAEGKDPSATIVGEVMTRDPETVRENTPVEDALRIMRNGCFRRVPVVDYDDRLVGLLSLDDILQLLAHDFARIGDLVERESPMSLTSV